MASEKISDYKCPNCNKYVEAQQEKYFKRCPDILIVQFDRFNKFKLKITKEIDCDQTLQLTDYSGATNLYEIRAVIQHHGPTMDSGHYTSIIKTSNTEYHHFDDHSVCFFLTNISNYFSFINL